MKNCSKLFCLAHTVGDLKWIPAVWQAICKIASRMIDASPQLAKIRQRCRAHPHDEILVFVATDTANTLALQEEPVLWRHRVIPAVEIAKFHIDITRPSNIIVGLQWHSNHCAIVNILILQCECIVEKGICNGTTWRIHRTIDTTIRIAIRIQSTWREYIT